MRHRTMAPAASGSGGDVIVGEKRGARTGHIREWEAWTGSETSVITRGGLSGSSLRWVTRWTTIKPDRRDQTAQN
jgi:hypothetical protein